MCALYRRRQLHATGILHAHLSAFNMHTRRQLTLRAQAGSPRTACHRMSKALLQALLARQHGRYFSRVCSTVASCSVRVLSLRQRRCPLSGLSFRNGRAPLTILSAFKFDDVTAKYRAAMWKCAHVRGAPKVGQCVCCGLPRRTVALLTGRHQARLMASISHL